MRAQMRAIAWIFLLAILGVNALVWLVAFTAPVPCDPRFNTKDLKCIRFGPNSLTGRPLRQ